MRGHCRLIVLTGGPGAGKTAVLEVVRRHFPAAAAVLPESASILFGGGFPRRKDEPGHRCAQRAIFHVQRELERMALEASFDGDPGSSRAVVLCDRGTLDGLAYWPGNPEEFFMELNTSREAEFARYDAVIHLRTPPSGNGYNHLNPVRTETAEEAATLDTRILEVWAGHPHRHVVESTQVFLEKVGKVLALLKEDVPELRS